MILSFQMIPEHDTEMFSTASWSKKPYGENTCVARLPSGMKYSILGHEFNVYESTVYILKGVFKGNDR